jgi:predicted enzyme related to lactoylglutathione lyase
VSPGAGPSAAARTPQDRTAGGDLSAIGLVRHHTDYTSHDMAAVQRFYVDVLGFSRTERSGDYVVVHTSEQSSLGFMPPMPVPPEQWRPPREPALYFMVRDVDEVVDRLRRHGVPIEVGPMDTPWGHRFAAVLDPEGRRVCFAHPLPQARNR